jgi:hypothetical protein
MDTQGIKLLGAFGTSIRIGLQKKVAMTIRPGSKLFPVFFAPAGFL